MSLLLTIALLGVLCLTLEVLNLRKIIVPTAIAVLLALFGVAVNDVATGSTLLDCLPMPEMIAWTAREKAFSALFVLLAALIITLIPYAYKNRPEKHSDFTAILLFLLAGAIAMTTFSNLSMFFVGLEVLSIALYVLAASDVRNKASNEAGMKYFLMGAFASSFILFGIALVYGATGSFNTDAIIAQQTATLPGWYYVGVTLILIGLLFKVSAAPFHFWAPDVYQGSPTLVTATMSTLVKVVALSSLYYIMSILIPANSSFIAMTVVAISILTMTVGNITALKQTDIKRMLAFSGISHAGFMLMLLLVLGNAHGTLLYYAAAYSLAGLAAFAVILTVGQSKGNHLVQSFAGLGKTHPMLAVVLASALLSMAGIPIFSGFMAKFMVFGQMLGIEQYALVVIGVINSIVSVFYYFRIINLMFTQEAEGEAITTSRAVYAVAVIAIVLNLALGIFPSVIAIG